MLIIHSTSCCDICLDEYTLARAANSPHAISCGHIFCLKCLRTLYPRTCPFCRKRFDLNRIKKLHVANEPNEEDGTKLALDLRSTILLKRVASVSGEDASDEDILEVLNDVVEWLSTQEDWSSSYQPLGVAFIALHEYRSARQALAEKTKECEDLKKELSNLEQSAVEDDGKQSNQMDIGPQIHFYHSHRRYYEFTNFSDHPVIFGGKTYPTSQHLYQSFKFQKHQPDLAEHIRLNCPRPDDALLEARRFQAEVRPDWTKVNIQKMEETLWRKFTQHPDLREQLLSTGNAELIFDASRDSFWGVGEDGRGRNEFGKALERLRTDFSGS